MDSTSAQKDRSPLYKVAGRVLMKIVYQRWSFGGVCACERERVREEGGIDRQNIRHFGGGRP